MKISIFGLGYVGAVSAGCLAGDGHEVVGVDPNPAKVDLIHRGVTPIVEKDMGELISRGVAQGKLHATADAREAVLATDVSLVCVGTPSQPNGNLDLRYVKRVCEEIGSALHDKPGFHVVAIRSTMLPGSMRGVVLPALEGASGKAAGSEFGVCINPEFLREGSAVWDYRNPPKTVIGESDPRAGDVLVRLYEALEAPLVRTSLETAEMVKYADNAWHAVKVVFANEIGNLAKALGLDGHAVMDIFCRDTKLNLSPYYLKPGFAFGGSCLPKDLRALNYKAKTLDLELPLLGSVLQSNQRQIQKGMDMIMACDKQKIGVLGFAFKSGTDDLRESPLVTVIEGLIGKGYDLRLYDRNVSLAALTGANRDFILNRIPHISRLMVETLDEVLAFAEVVVIGNAATEFKAVLDRIGPHQIVIDLARAAPAKKSEPGRYDGICW